MSTIERFIRFLSVFRNHKEWLNMETCVEDSPWHREKSTAHHTFMMVQWYMENLWDARSEWERMMTLVAIVFHDVGKPVERRWSDQKNRFQFSGHEQTSAEMLRSWANNNRDEWAALGLEENDLGTLCLMVYHHVPFAYKRLELRALLKQRYVEAGVSQAWIDLIMCDQYGRISDTHQENQDKVFEWLDGWIALEPVGHVDTSLFPRQVNPFRSEDLHRKTQ